MISILTCAANLLVAAMYIIDKPNRIINMFSIIFITSLNFFGDYRLPPPQGVLLSMINCFVMLNLVQHLANVALYLLSGKIPKRVRDDIFVYSLFYISFEHNTYIHSFFSFYTKLSWTVVPNSGAYVTLRISCMSQGQE